VEPWHARNFRDADEVVETETFRSEMVNIGGVTVAHELYQPGWRWSTHVRPMVRTDWCRIRHIGMIARGRLHVLLEDGTEFECGPLDVVDVPAGHDAWVVGDEILETFFWTGVRGWLDPVELLRERVLVSIVFTDIVDSTGTAGRLGPSAWAELVSAHEARTRDTLARFGGREVKMTGDGVLAIFDGAARAVRCAQDLLDAGRGLGLGMRGAVHTGEVEIGDDDLRGVAVHEASRILGLAGDGEVLVSATTAGLIGDAGFTIEDRGEHELRGLDGARRLYLVR
jgi:class 3 adenylate cyclase